MEYTITIPDLVKRPIIRNDFKVEWMNKMTDEELQQFDKECYDMCMGDGLPEKYQNVNTGCLSKYIDRGILYNLFKQKN